MSDKTSEIIEKYLEALQGDARSAVVWTFICIHRMMIYTKQKNPEIIEDFEKDPLISHLIPTVLAFADEMYKDIKK